MKTIAKNANDFASIRTMDGATASTQKALYAKLLYGSREGLWRDGGATGANFACNLSARQT